MRKQSSRFLFFVLLCMSNDIAHAQRFNNLIIIAGDEYEDNGVLVGATLPLALHNACAPIIVTQNILNNYLKLAQKTDFQPFVEKLKTAAHTSKDAFVKVKEEIAAKKFGRNVLLAFITFPENWYVYTVNNSDLLVLIPQKYITEKIIADWGSLLKEVAGFSEHTIKNQIKNINSVDQKSDAIKIQQLIAQSILDFQKNSAVDPKSARIALLNRMYDYFNDTITEKNITSISINPDTFIEYCGFNTKNLKKIADLSPKSLEDQLENISDYNSIEFTTHLASILHRKQRPILQKNARQIGTEEKKRDEEKLTEPQLETIKQEQLAEALSAKWLIYIFGHGQQSEEVITDDIPEKIKNIQTTISTLKQAKKINIEEYEQEFRKKEEDPIRFPFLEQRIDTLDKEISHQEELLAQLKKTQQTAQHTSNVWLTTGETAGLSNSEFLKLIKYLNTEIDVSFLFYETCYSGGYNRILVTELLNQLSVNYYIGTTGLNEKTVYKTLFGESVLLIRNDDATITLQNKKNALSYSSFFKQLRFFFNPSKATMPTGYDNFASILKNILSTEWQLEQTYIRIPKLNKSFNAIAIDKEVLILTHARAKAAELEGFLDAKQYKAILVYPAHIRTALLIKPFEFIVSQRSPETITQNIFLIPQQYGVTHLFDSISTPSFLHFFLDSTITYNRSFYKTFLIKELKLYDRTLHNFIMCIRLESSNNILVDVLYEEQIMHELPSKKTPYVVHIRSKTKGSVDPTDIEDALKNKKIIHSKSLATFASLVLPPAQADTFAQIKTASISLLFEKLAKGLLDEIHEEDMPEKPGALGAVLKKHQLKANAKDEQTTTLEKLQPTISIKEEKKVREEKREKEKDK